MRLNLDEYDTKGNVDSPILSVLNTENRVILCYDARETPKGKNNKGYLEKREDSNVQRNPNLIGQNQNKSAVPIRGPLTPRVRGIQNLSRSDEIKKFRVELL